MKNRLLYICLTAFFLVTTFVAKAQTYAPIELEALRGFLRQADASNGLNLSKIGLSVSDTAQWTSSENWVVKVDGLTWNTDNPKKLTAISWFGKRLSGILDASQYTLLANLNCSNNKITVLDVSKNTELIELTCAYNQLTKLDVSNSIGLISLLCAANELTVLDVSKNTSLIGLDCSINKLKSLDISNNVLLSGFDCSANDLTVLDVSKNIVLAGISCQYNELKVLDVSSNTMLVKLWCYNNKLTSLVASNNTALGELNCDSNRLPLSVLYPIISNGSKIVMLNIGSQDNVFFTDTTMMVSNAASAAIDLSSEVAFGGANTVFTVDFTEGGKVPTENYTINNGVIRFSKAGKYKIGMSNAAFATDAKTKAVTGLVNVKENSELEGLNMFDEGFTVAPNPTNGKVIVRSAKPMTSLIVYGLNGQKMYKIETPGTICEIDLSDLPAATYVVNVDGRHKKVMKVM